MPFAESAIPQETAPENGPENREFSAHTPQNAPVNRALSPKELVDKIGGVRCVEWVQRQCKCWRTSAGRNGIRTVTGRPPYLIPADEARRVIALFNGKAAA